MERQIEIDIAVEDCHQLREALAYLTTWCLFGYDGVYIMDDWVSKDNMSLTAVYTHSQLGSRYTIGAIWDEEKKKYTFHS